MNSIAGCCDNNEVDTPSNRREKESTSVIQTNQLYGIPMWPLWPKESDEVAL